MAEHYFDWIREAGVPQSCESRIAYRMLTAKDGKYQGLSTFRRSILRCELELEFGSERAAKWIYSPHNLDFLQLAVVCDDQGAVAEMLSLGSFHRKGYKENSHTNKKLVHVNHPLHLASAFGSESILHGLLMRMDARVLREKGIVTVAVDRETPVGRPLLVLPRETKGTALQLASTYHNKRYLKNTLLRVLQRLETRTLSPALIERFWEVLSFVHKEEDTRFVWELFMIPSAGRALSKTIFRLFCQLLNSARLGLTDTCLRGCLPVSHFHSLGQATDIARCLSLPDLYQAIAILNQPEVSPRRGSAEVSCSHKRFYRRGVGDSMRNVVVEVFRKEARERTLQGRCVQVILRSVGGDPRHRKTLQLPRGLHFLFPVLFQKEHDQLTENSE